MTVRTRTLALTLAAVGVGTLAAVALPTPASAAPPSTFQASVAADGSLTSGRGATSSVGNGTGQYEVTFNRSLQGCAYTATTVNASTQAVQAFVAGGHGSANGVYVETKNQGGGLSAAAFDLVVDCGATATPFAVVGFDGSLVRGTAGTTVTPSGTGTYAVTFPVNVAQCAALATAGHPTDGTLVSPSAASTGLGANVRTVYVETKNPGGGLQAGVPFHLVVLCPGATGVSGLAVRSDGVAVRSFGDALSFRAATGQYTVVTRTDVSRCATVATRGSVTRAVPFAPSTVEIAGAPAPNTVSFQVRDLLAGGGALSDQSFHAAVVC